MDEIDYKQLLLKYIDYVGDSEGTDFIYGYWGDDRFSEKEWKELERLHDEANRMRGR